MAYVELERLKESLAIEDTDSDDVLRRSLDAATTWIDNYTGRTFTLDAEDTTRYFYPNREGIVDLPDLVTVTSIKLDTVGDRTYSTTLAAAEYEFRPIDGPPFTEVRMWPTSSRAFISTERVQIVGTFGWPSVPKPVEQACLILASRYYKRGEAPFGVLQNTDLGQYTRISKEDPDVVSLLGPYRVTGSSWVLV